MELSHIISHGILAATGLGVGWQCVQCMRLYEKLLWGFFLLTTALTALAGLGSFAGLTAIGPVRQSLATLSDTLGLGGAVVGVWALLTRQPVSGPVFWVTVLAGLGLFFGLSLPDFAPFVQVAQAVWILALMLLGTVGMLRRDHRAGFVIGAALVLAVATKAEAVTFLPPVDFYQYAVALALLLLGKAVDVRATA